ncbi:MAG: GH3 auxin-responsive promoter family protein [Candidatus Gracilibacteria bacterium]|nr:GH3 auxin-responsive promoter family protein [Candidatus Gracilibacteria bacterium]
MKSFFSEKLCRLAVRNPDKKEGQEDGVRKLFQLLAWGEAKISTASYERLPQGRENIECAQDKQLKTLGQGFAGTAFAEKHDLRDSTLCYEKWREKIPVFLYDEKLAPDYPHTLSKEIQKTFDHPKESILWNHPIKHWAQTAGTTGGKKIIPVPDEAIKNHHHAAATTLRHFVAQKGPSALDGAHLAFGGTKKELPGGIRTLGDISHLTLSASPLAAQMVPLKMEILGESDPQKKLDQIAEKTKNKNITGLAGIPKWHAELVKRILRQEPGKTPREIWPNLKVFFHGGTPFGPYRELFEEWFPDADFRETYTASEGYFGADVGQGEMQLFTQHGILHELIPVKDFRQFQASGDERCLKESIRPCWDAEADQEYVLVTTAPAFPRCVVGDVIQIHDSDRLTFSITGRVNHELSAADEQLREGDMDQAIAALKQKFPVLTGEYCITYAEKGENNSPRHLLVLEVEKTASENREALTRQYDEILGEVNSKYGDNRRVNALGMPEIQLVPSGVFTQTMKRLGKEGGQNKVPRIDPGGNFIQTLQSVAREV